ncbi:MAG TPA: trehalose-phosphatase [Rubrivivax sp.]|jgi:trehalose 6-phosphate phosphatase|nr:trehalose-phosphatase [Rubrivivax sp.]
MPHLFSHEGMAHLSATLRRAPLLAFDFDGTLAPIVPRPEDARVSPGIAGRLQRLARLLPVAVVSGRAVADVRARLGFEPRYVLGNHGAEGLRWPGQEHQHEALAGLRQCLQERHDELVGAGITVEDKGGSLALHYRLARDREQAIALLQSVLHPPRPEWRVFGGKMVVNVAPAAAPDKADAVMSLLAHCGAESAFFAGDDINDEPVFAAAPPHWLTVRIGRDDPTSRAMYFLDGPSEMGLLLQRMLDLLHPPAGSASAQS